MYLVKSIIAGFIMAALPGAVQTSVLQSSLEGQFKSTLKFALGAAIMDGLYMFLVYFGVVQLLVAHNLLFSIVSLVGAGYIFYIGIDSLWKSLKIVEKVDIKKRKFWQGVVLVLFHPPTILYFIGLADELELSSLKSISEVMLVSLMLFFGALICFLFVALLGKIVKKYSSIFVIKIFRVSVSCLLIIFVIKMLVEKFILS